MVLLPLLLGHGERLETLSITVLDRMLA